MAAGAFGLGVLLPRTAPTRMPGQTAYGRRLPLGLLLISLAMTVWLLERMDPPPAPLPERSPEPSLTPAQELHLVTDAGTVIPGYTATGECASDTEEQEFRNILQREGAIFRVAGPDTSTNCHGWVFTGGRTLLLGQSVEQILHDNGYQRIERSQIGDLIIYRNTWGTITHSGLVKALGEGQFVLIESKWGSEGRYFHEPGVASNFGEFTYYRSARHGHLLRGCESPIEVSFFSEAKKN
jgi:hypothetical protein